MMRCKDVDRALYRAARKLLKASEVKPRDLKTKELINESLLIENSERCVITNPARKLSLKYLKAELAWYLSGERTIDSIKDYASMWEKLTDENGEVNSNYGYFVFFQKMPRFEGTQYEWTLKHLEEDEDSRQALINFNQVEHKYDDVKDFVCTINTQYLIRDRKLIAITNMRSNDLIYGFSYDIPFFSFVQGKLVEDLRALNIDVERGALIHNVASLHVYERHFKMLEDIVKTYESQYLESKTLKEALMVK